MEILKRSLNPHQHTNMKDSLIFIGDIEVTDLVSQICRFPVCLALVSTRFYEKVSRLKRMRAIYQSMGCMFGLDRQS